MLLFLNNYFFIFMVVFIDVRDVVFIEVSFKFLVFVCQGVGSGGSFGLGVLWLLI